MSRVGRRILVIVGGIGICIAIAGGGWVGARWQSPDLAFDVSVSRPAFTRDGPRVLVDEAHRNFHRTTGTFSPFVALLRNDGFEVDANRRPFTRAALAAAQVLVVVNAMGARYPFLPGATRAAFSNAECDVVREWVRDGGSLLLVADHAPMGASASALASRFGIEMSTGRAFDETRFDATRNSPSWLEFSADDGALPEHPITRGRDSAERLRRVVSFTGQSLSVPPGAVAILPLGPKSFDILPSGGEIPGAGRAQGVALELGRGRVVVLGEAAMLTAQVTGRRAVRFGMNLPGNDDRQLALNIMHWLARTI
jgi:hypothetical protein